MVNMGELFKYPRIGNIDMELVKMTPKEIENFALNEGDLLFARQSLVAEGAGKCAIISQVDEIETFESHLIRVRLNKKVANPMFYFYYFQSYIGQSKTQSLVNQVSAAGIRASELSQLKVDFPPICIQNKVAFALSQYDDLIEINNHRIAILEEMEQKLYREWFVHFRFPGHENVKMVESKMGLIPENWTVGCVEDLLEYSRGKSYTSKELEGDITIPFINLKNIQSYGGFRQDGTKKFSGKYKETQVVKNGDIVMAVTDMTQERRLVGQVARISNILDLAVISMDLIKLIPHIETTRDYVYVMFRYSGISLKIAEYANGANVLHLNPEIIKQQQCIIPDTDTMIKFGEIVSKMNNFIEKLIAKNINLQKTRDLILSRLISGDIDVTKIDIPIKEG